MGFISRFKGAQAFRALEADVKREAIGIAQLSPSLEPFEYLLRVWENQMRKYGKATLALSGEHIVHIWAILPDPQIALELLSRHMAAYAIPDFQELPQFAQLNSAMAPIVASIQRDNGVEMNRRFQATNPRCFAAFLSRHGRGPFTPADDSRIADLLRYS